MGKIISLLYIAGTFSFAKQSGSEEHALVELLIYAPRLSD